MLRFIFSLCLLISSLSVFCKPYTINLSTDQSEALGLLIWKNEGQQKLQHLTTWNRGEDFPSLGLGHFIWYPYQQKGPFKEQFPALLHYFQKNGVQPPAWILATPFAPWKSREQFYLEFEGKQLSGLRTFLSEHLDLQVKFIVQRLELAIPRIIADCDVQQKKRIEENLKQLTSTTAGLFALLDYINFKGDGIATKERYQGEGWGLKQVLFTMPKEYQHPLRAFALSADEVLTRRVKNAPRDESRWLKGWRVRVHGYQRLIKE